MRVLKKWVAIILVLLIAITNLSGCSYILPFLDDLVPSESLISSDTAAVSSEEGGESTSSKKSGTKNKSSSSKKQSSSSKPVGSATKKETLSTDSSVKDPQNVGKIKELVISSKHTAVKSSSYYQYSSSTGTIKTLYNLILTAIKNSRNVVNFTNITPSKEQISIAYQRVLADHPQFFYVSRSFWYISGTKSNNIKALVLSYFDGEVSDEIDDDLNFIKTADRTVINQKIDKLKTEIEKILSTIPLEESEVIKEKKIYDYVLNKVRYEKVAAENSENVLFAHYFDLYGAVVNKTSVCEGYAKMFQYLCYCVGINATQVIGVGNKEDHMWNAVLIEGEWYQADLTWSDTDMAWSDLTRIFDYSYFNQTTENILKDHTIDSSCLAVPVCNSTKNSFINLFAIEITDLNSPPANYENVVANIIKSGSNRIYVYVNRDGSVVGNLNFSRNYERYINNNMIYEGSDFNIYLSNLGITLSREIKKIENFYVLTLNY